MSYIFVSIVWLFIGVINTGTFRNRVPLTLLVMFWAAIFTVIISQIQLFIGA